ncbi:MAG: beta-glucosidase [bacterium]|nr:beta-glucosidase [bacterium]
MDAFVWGAATAAYQIEGAVREDGRGASIWDRFCAVAGNIANGESGAVACDHYHRMDEDVELLRQLGVDAYRFSIAWPRVLPQGTGRVNQRGLDFYRRLVDRLLEAGVRPYATLYHWDLPAALHDRFGGWIGRETAYAFAELTEAVSRALGDRVAAWITLNEPWVCAWLGYARGEHAPGYRDPQLGLQAAHHLLLAHGLAVPVLRRNAPRAEVGVTLNFSPIAPASSAPLDVAAAEAADVNLNLWFLDRVFGRGYQEHTVPPPLKLDALTVAEGDMAAIAAPIDFLGVNYYTRFFVAHDAQGGNPFGVALEAPAERRTTMGWEVYPQGLFETLVRIARRHAPRRIYVTENGMALPDRPDAEGGVHDAERIAYLEAHVIQARRAIAAGVPLAGYFVWSLLDNFEWAEGYRQRFGLIYVDYATQRRIVKDSGRWYTRMIAASRRTAGAG